MALPEGKPTLKQYGISADACSVAVENQLDRAAVTFGDINNFNKAWICTSVLSHCATWHLSQVKKLRSCKSSLEWELEQLLGGCHGYIRSAIQQITVSTNYSKCGIEQTFRPTMIAVSDVRVQVSNDNAAALWDLAFATAREAELRSLQYVAGYPKRATLLLHSVPAIRQQFFMDVKRDFELWEEFCKFNDDWTETFKKRACWQKVDVQQLVGCCREENWEATTRPLDEFIQFVFCSLFSCKVLGPSSKPRSSPWLEFNRVELS